MNEKQRAAEALLGTEVGGDFPDWLPRDDYEGNYLLTLLGFRLWVKDNGAKKYVAELVVDEVTSGRCVVGQRLQESFDIFDKGQFGTMARKSLHKFLCALIDRPADAETGTQVFKVITPENPLEYPEDWVCPLQGQRVRLTGSHAVSLKGKPYTKWRFRGVQQTKEDRVARQQELQAAGVDATVFVSPTAEDKGGGANMLDGLI